MHVFRLLLTLLLVAALAAGCMGGDDDDATATSPAEASSPSIATVARPTPPVTPTAELQATSSPVAVTATSTVEPTATVAVSPTATTTPSITESPTSESGVPVTLRLVESGFSEVQSYDEVAFGFIVENPDPRNAVVNTEYRVTVYSGGSEIESDTGFLDYVLPGQRLGVGGSVFIPSGEDADSIVVELSAGQAADPAIDPGFNVDRVTYYRGSVFPFATGLVSTTSSAPLQDFEVFALAYDEAGAIIGGGYTFVSFIHAGSTTGVQVNVASANEPASVELYPVVTSLTIFGLADTSTRDAQPLTVTASGFGPSVFDNELGWGFVVENPNQELAAETTAYQVTAYASDGVVLGVYSSFVSLLLPGERLGLGGSFYVPTGTVAERLVFEVLGRYFQPTTTQADFLTITDVAFVPDEFSPRVTGTIQSNLERELADVEVYAVAYNQSGQIIGGGFAFIDLIEAEGQASAEVTIAVGETPATVELYATVGSLAEIE